MIEALALVQAVLKKLSNKKAKQVLDSVAGSLGYKVHNIDFVPRLPNTVSSAPSKEGTTKVVKQKPAMISQVSKKKTPEYLEMSKQRDLLVTALKTTSVGDVQNTELQLQKKTIEAAMKQLKLSKN
jgi:hypothetical protein